MSTCLAFTPFEFSIYACGFCGLAMVLGSIWLLQTGAIKLSEVGKGGGLTVELEKKIKLTTTYPALGLFIIGLAFIALGVWVSKPAMLRPLNIVGRISADEPDKITIKVQPDQATLVANPDSDGKFNKEYYFAVNQMVVEINAAGHLPLNRHFTIAPDANGQLKLPPDLKFVRTKDPQPQVGTIETLPVGVSLAPLNEGKAF